MRSDYEKSMYEFYTQSENFETMLHVADQAKWVSQKLIIDFWTETRTVLEEILSKRPGNWCVEINGDWKWRWVKIWAYKQHDWRLSEAYPLLSVAVENLQLDKSPYIGIHIGFDSKMIKGDEIKTRILELEQLKGDYETDSSAYWARWKYIGIDHGDAESLAQLLPENRKITIENVISEFIELLDLAEEDISNLLKDKSLFK